MPTFPSIRYVNQIVVSPGSPQSLGAALNAVTIGLGTLAWPTANKAFYIPFSVNYPLPITRMLISNATPSGNVDVGIYDLWGTRLRSSGSTLHTGTSVVQDFNITDITLNPGLYYLAMAMDNNVGTIEVWTMSAGLGRSLGIMEETSAFPLPATASFSALSGTLRLPFVGASQRDVV